MNSATVARGHYAAHRRLGSGVHRFRHRGELPLCCVGTNVNINGVAEGPAPPPVMIKLALVMPSNEISVLISLRMAAFVASPSSHLRYRAPTQMVGLNPKAAVCWGETLAGFGGKRFACLINLGINGSRCQERFLFSACVGSAAGRLSNTIVSPLGLHTYPSLSVLGQIRVQNIAPAVLCGHVKMHGVGKLMAQLRPRFFDHTPSHGGFSKSVATFLEKITTSVLFSSYDWLMNVISMSMNGWVLC